MAVSLPGRSGCSLMQASFGRTTADCEKKDPACSRILRAAVYANSSMNFSLSAFTE